MDYGTNTNGGGGLFASGLLAIISNLMLFIAAMTPDEVLSLIAKLIGIGSGSAGMIVGYYAVRYYKAAKRKIDNE